MRRKQRSRRFWFWWFWLPVSLVPALAVVGAGCALEPAEPGAPHAEAPGELGVSEQAITAARFTTLVPWSVRIDLKLQCSGLVLTQHYILTAGHCVAGHDSLRVPVKVYWAHQLGGAQMLYDGHARVLKNPEFHEHQRFGDPDEDVGLLKLEGDGVSLSHTGRAKLWGWNRPDINRDPWEQSSQDREFTVVGWGKSGVGSSCSSPAGAKRIGVGFEVDVTGADAEHVTAPRDTTVLCGGDSGAPWMFERGGQYIAFAVGGSYVPDLVIAGDYERGALIKAKRDWLYQATATMDIELICASAGFAGSQSKGVTYEQCREQLTENTPPPGPACPSGQHCCRITSPGLCAQCIANDRECP